MSAVPMMYDYTKTFEVLVGEAPNQKRFTVYQDMICQRSAFFRTARSERWLKDPTKPTDLVDDTPEVFQQYLHCLYTSEFVPLKNQGDGVDFTVLFRLYVFAEKIQDYTTANMVVDEVISVSLAEASIPDLAETSYVYQNSSSGSPLRRLVRDYSVHHADELLEKDLRTSQPGTTEALMDIHGETLRLKNFEAEGVVGEVCGERVEEKAHWHYHRHDQDHPPCEQVGGEEAESEEDEMEDGESEEDEE